MNLIVAVDENWGIGYGGTQTVVLPEDRRYFRSLTDGAVIILGHRTLLDFPGGKPLPGRKNIVLSKHMRRQVDGAVVVSSLGNLFHELGKYDTDNIFVVGGDSVFRLLLDYCRYAYVTKIKASPPADTFFPNLDALENWSVDNPGTPKIHEGIEYAFMRYINKSPLDYKQNRGEKDV